MFDHWLAWYRAAAHAALARGRGHTVDDRVLDDARETAVGAAQGTIADLVARLGLDGEDVDFLWCVVGASVEPIALAERSRVVADAARGLDLASYTALVGARPEVAATFALRYSAAHPLIRRGVIELDDPSVPAAARYRVDRVTAARLRGDFAFPSEVVPLAPIPDASWSPGQAAALARVTAALAPGEPLLVVVEGTAGAGKRTAIAHAAAAHAHAAVALAAHALAPTPDAWPRGLRALSREQAFRDIVPVIDGVDALAPGDPRWGELARWLDDVPTTVVCTSATRGLAVPGARRVVRLDWPVPDVEHRRQIWVGAGLALADADVDELAFRYQLGIGAIRRAASTAVTLGRGAGVAAAGFREVIEAIHGETAERMQTLATKVQSTSAWDDLVISDDTRAQIDGFVARVRHSLHVFERWKFRQKVGRATGSSVLFSGPPGTGKTMVAGLMAKELGLELYQVDLSRVVSKWVGETEKQLGALFDAAAGGHVMLLFDEADALFTKRSTDVKSATDRYANLEVNYLLQRVEAFGGVTVLTTNLDTNLDDALRRRLSAHVVFWAPDEDERAKLWRKFLAGAPQAADIDIAALVDRYEELSGGHIKNAVVAAAFTAASRGAPIDQAMLESAARAERASLGKVLANSADRR